jgi:crotonobetainyl-CoA:carnitine CoA-transferase CaiB-like acyl-CoA transferase
MRLDGVRVLDLTRLLPGPYATQLLADAGADVVKIEDTSVGDYARHMPPYTESGVGAVFDAVNRGKRSVCLDLKSGSAREAFYDLVVDADVVIEQFRPGVVERLGVDYETLGKHNPDLVYCSLSGYGQNGPLADKAGHDLNYVGLAGMLDLSREDETATPSPLGYQVGDMAGGLFAAFAVVSALLSRELGSTGGEYLDCSLTDPVISFSQTAAAEVFAGGDPRPGETALTGGYPWYDVYECADGEYVTLAALEPQFWQGFCEATGREDLTGYHMTDNEAEIEALREELETMFAGRTRDEWVEALVDEEAAVDGVYTPSEALSHPQTEARGYIERPEDAPPRVGFPARGSDIDHDDPAGPAPGQGAHTDEVLTAAGVSEERLAELHEDGVAR